MALYPTGVAILSLLTAGTAVAAPVVSLDPAPKKVACVGGSITWGYWLEYPIKRKTYPDQLAILLGPGYQTRNYGFGGATAGRYAGQDDRAYIYSGEQFGTVKWQPDIIIAGLGVNDCNSSWADPEKFEQGYRDLVGTWRAGGRNPSIFLWNRLTPDYRGPIGEPGYPGNVFGPYSVFTTNNDGMAANRPGVQAKADLLGPALGVGLIDAYSQLSSMPQWAGEGLHLVEPGLKRLAEVNYCQAWPEQASSALPRLTEVAPNPGAGSPGDESGIKYPWVELYNPSSFGISLDNLALDSGAGSTRFIFTNSTVLWPGERRIVFLSAMNRTSPIKNLHANFTVDNSEGEVRLLSRSGTVVDSIGWRNWTPSGSLGRVDAVTSVLVGPDSSHQRLLTSTPPQGWQEQGFNDSAWVVGTGGAGSELPLRTEAQFMKRWSADQAPSGVWTLTGSGWAAQGDGTYKAAGTGPGLTVPSWITGADSSWTAEAKVKLNGFQSGASGGYVIRGGTRTLGGAFTTLYIQSNQVVYGGPYEHGAVLSTEDNTDDFHVFRIAYHAPTRNFFVWRDGVEISQRTDGRTRDSSRFTWLAMGALHGGAALDAVVDYSSYDTSGAYAPGVNGYVQTGNADTKPLTTDSTGPITGNTSCLLRIPFNGVSQEVAAMKLKMEFDDGFRAWLNGTEIASCNAPASGTTAPLARDNSWGIDALTLDVSAFANLVQPAGNVLAVQIFNATESDGRCFGRAALELVSPVGEIARYFSTPNAGAASGPGSPLPAQGWVYEQASGGAAVPLVLDLDSDGDGRSNLLEYSQGTNPSQADSVPIIAENQGRANFLWRDNPEIGWRLMESSDQQTWHPAMVSGPPQISDSGIPGMLFISQAVIGSGKIYRVAAVEQPSWTTWAQRYFTAAEISTGQVIQDSADPDGDHLPNFVEYAIASNPRAASNALIHSVPGTRNIAFPEPGPGRGAEWHLESSANLRAWHQTANPALNCLIDPVSGRYELEATDPTLPADQGFLRVDYEQTSGN